jgi:hypothetical protein
MASPNGGETLRAGDACTMIWGGPSTAISYKVLYSVDSGHSWEAITPQAITGTSTVWTVPPLKKNTTSCLTKVVGYTSDPHKKAGTDKSNKPFAIEVVKLTSPNNRESFSSGQEITVTWTTYKTMSDVDQVQLAYSLDNGTTWKNFSTQPLAHTNPGSFAPTLPTVKKTKSKCKVKVVLRDSGGAKVGSDLSDGVFTILGP